MKRISRFGLGQASGSRTIPKPKPSEYGVSRLVADIPLTEDELIEKAARIADAAPERENGQ